MMIVMELVLGNRIFVPWSLKRSGLELVQLVVELEVELVRLIVELELEVIHHSRCFLEKSK